MNRDVLCSAPESSSERMSGPSIKEVFQRGRRPDRASQWEKAAAGFGLVFVALIASLSIWVSSGNKEYVKEYVRGSNATPIVTLELHRAETAAADGLTEAIVSGPSNVYPHSGRVTIRWRCFQMKYAWSFLVAP